MKLIRVLVLVSVVCTSLIGCAAPKFVGQPVNAELVNNNDVTIQLIRDDQTRPEFGDTIAQWLGENGYEYRLVPDGTDHDLESLTIEYVGYWKWDFALFLSRADINAFYQGKKVGSVNYKAPNSRNNKKYGKASERIKYMLDILFGKITSSEAADKL